MSTSLLGKHVSLNDAAAYGAHLALRLQPQNSHHYAGTLDTSDKRLQLVCSILSAGARAHSPDQKAIIEQLLFNALQMTVEAGFAPDKVSAFGGIVLETFDASMAVTSLQQNATPNP